MTGPSLPAPTTLDAATVLARALEAAHDRAIDLFDGLDTLNTMGDADRVEMKGDALRWLADKFRADANEILSDLDHAQFAGRGGVYDTSAARYATPDDDPKFRDMLWQATGGAAGEPAEDRAEAAAEKGPHTERTPDEKMTLDNSEGHSDDRGGAIDPARRENARELASEVQTIAEVLAHLAGTDGHGYRLDPGHVGYLASRLASVGGAIEGIALGLPAEAQK